MDVYVSIVSKHRWLPRRVRALMLADHVASSRSNSRFRWLSGVDALLDNIAGTVAHLD
jgi:hypothetical protein